MSSSLSGLAAKGGRKSGGRRAGGLSKGAGQADKENTLGGDTYAFDDAEANGESPCADSKLQLGEQDCYSGGEGDCSSNGVCEVLPSWYQAGASLDLLCCASPCTADEGFGSSRKRSSLDFDEECEGNG